MRSMTFWGIVVLLLLLSAAVALGVARILGAFADTPEPESVKRTDTLRRYKQ